MNKLKKFLLYLFFLNFILLIIISLIYVAIVFKPSETLKIIDKALIYNYSVNFKVIDSNKNLFKPYFSAKEISFQNKKNDEIAYIDKFGIGLNIYESLTKHHLSLFMLEIDSIRISENSAGGDSEPFLIKGKNLNFLNNDLQIKSKNFSVLFNHENTQAVFHQGVINSYSFKSIEALFEASTDSVYYSSEHSFNSESLIESNFFDLGAFKNHDINLGLSSKGTFNFKTKESRRLDRLKFKNSKIVNKSGYVVDKINATIFGNKNSLYGLFQSHIPNQIIKGSIEGNNNETFKIRTDILIDMGTLIDPSSYFDINGNEIFRTVMNISQENTSIKLLSKLTNTEIYSTINEIKKDKNEILETEIFIENISNPTYKIKNKNIEASIDSKGYGFFSFGSAFKEVIKKNQHDSGLYIYIDLNEFDTNNIILENSSDDNSLLKSIKLKSKKFIFLDNTYFNQSIDITFGDEPIIIMKGDDLNGSVKIDRTNFIKIDLKNTKFYLEEIGSFESSLPNDISNINLRFIGKNIQTKNNFIQDIDFYLLRNKNVITLDNININSTRLEVGPNFDNQKAYISYNNNLDLYKIKGKYKLDNSSGYFSALSKYNFNFFETDINIKWNSLNSLVNLEGKFDFLIKDLNIDSDISESTFLRTLRILNLNAIIEGLDDVSDDILQINRASGKFILGKNRALIKSPIALETDEASLKWNGEVLKNQKGELDKLNLDLSLRLKISENIPWYAAIFGGIPAVAGGMVFENLFEDAIQDISTINFKVQGTINEPDIERLN